ncbi:MAG: cation diffusion facilitator family transporter [Myxococcales bacterium]|nr:MAG: cation diffusion facilitator family transporter [Myxococcales bacterium]
MTEGSRRAIVAAFVANLGIAVTKLAAYVATGAASMLAEAVHSFADTGNQGLLLLGGNLARREATSEHPFGFGRERYFWAFVVALVLFSLGSVFAVAEGVAKLRDPHELSDPLWAVGVLAVAIALEAWSLRTAVQETNRVRGTLGFWSFVRRTKSPELPVVLLEDVGALLGLIFALVAVLLAMVTGDARFDAMGSIAIGCLLAAIAWVLAREMRSLLLGEAASPRTQQAIREALATSPDLRRLIHLRTLHLGPEELLVVAKVEFDPSLVVAQLAQRIDAAEALIRARVPEARLIFLEPDVHRPTDTAGSTG